MSGGNMTVTKGTFTKDATGADPDSTDNGSAIDIQGGKLSMTGSDAKTFTITGSHVNGIKSSGGGTVTAEHTTFSMSGGTDVVPENGNKYGTDMFGINIDSGTVTANGCDITIYGTYSAGILSMGKNVDGSTVSVGAADNTASEIKVYVPESQKLLSSAGISSEGGKIQLTGDVNIETNGLGITARGPIDITGGEAKVTTTHGTGIYVSGATITNTATLTVESNITSGWSWVKRPENPDEDVNTNVNNGIYVENGSIDASAGTLNVTHTGVAGDTPADSTTDAATKSYAVFVKGDAEGGSQNTTVRIGKGSIAGNSAGGIYVSGGELTAGAVTVSAGGTALNDTFTAGAPTYAAGVLVETGTVTLSGAKIYSTALGVAVLGGNFKTEGTSSVTATRATGIYVQGGTVTNSGTLDVTSDLFDDSGNLYESAGADFGGSSTAGGNIYNGIFVNGGSLVSEGVSSILNVTFRGAAGDAPSSASGATKSYAVYVTNSSDDGATETTNTYASIREGALNAAQAGGVYVHGGDVVLGAQYNENDEVVGDGTVAINTGSLNGNTIDTSAGTYGAGVFADNGKAVLYGEVNVDCAAIGIVATAADTGTGTGAVTIKSGTTTITAYRSTGVYIRGGSLENSGTLTVDSKITNSTGGTASTAEDAYKWAGADIEGDTENENIYNGVYVKGGSLISNGTLNVNFTGVENDAYGKGQNANWTAQTAYQEYIVKSYAVRVDGGVGTKVSVNEGTITNQIGGGLYVTGVAPETIYELKDQTFDGLQNTANYTLVELKKVTIQAQGCDPNGFTAIILTALIPTGITSLTPTAGMP